MLWEAAAGGASLLGGLLGSSAKSKAAKQAAAQQEQNLQMQRALAIQNLNANRPLLNDTAKAAMGYVAPYYNLGTEANSALERALGLAPDANGNYSNELTRPFNAQDYQNDIGYTPMASNNLTREQYAQMYGVPALVSNTLTADEWRNDNTGTYTATPTTLEELQATPGYQFQLQQGLQSVNNSAAARGALMSGRTMKELNNYAQGQASTGFADAWNRGQQAYQNAFARKQARFEQGQQGYQNAFNNQQTLYQNGQNALNNAYSRYNNNQQNTFNRLNDVANRGYQAGGYLANATTDLGSRLVDQNNQFAQSMSGNQQNYADNMGNIAYGQGQNRANLYQGMGNSLADLFGNYATNNVGLGNGGGGR